MNTLTKSARILTASVKGFFRDQCFLHASSLTFYTLLSLVPILAVAFGLGKGFGFEKNLEKELYQRFQEHAEVVKYVVDFAQSLLEQVEGGLIAGIGAVLLFLFVLSLLWTIENSMNTIWKVKRFRSPFRMLTDYLAMMIICPFFFVIASSLMVFLTTQMDLAIEQHILLKKMTPLSFLFYRGLTLVMIWVLFSCLYIIMPNTEVQAKYGILAGIIAGTIYYLIQSAIIQFQIGVSQYNAIYGSFAVLPLFLFWLQLSWISVLLGAQLAYNTERLSPLLGRTKRGSQISKAELALLLTQRLVQRFRNGSPAENVYDLSMEFGIPASLTREILSELQKAGMIAEITSDKYGQYFQPAQALQNITVYSVISALDKNLHEMITINASDDAKTIQEAYKFYEKQSAQNPSNIPLSQLNHDAQ
ncbi:MAG: YhjD/YihY/BrkB family envelope integrity protein [Waddliaceae bacterium]